MSRRFQFSLRAVFTIIAAVAALLGLATFHPPESVIVAALVAFGAAFLLLGDISRARFRAKYAALQQCDVAYRKAARSAHASLRVALACAGVGTAIIIAGYETSWEILHQAGWGILVASLLPAFASRLFFDKARLFQDRWLEIAHNYEQARIAAASGCVRSDRSADDGSRDSRGD